ncbi:MAG TPA: His/Gly/Thr/Pro-type tRNA ligase C-terminal domain-containing protein, partial [Candidatus Elarobacter sp.]
IHRALAGSMERFFGVLIEHFAGAFPAWLAPVQAVVVPISEQQLDYAYAVRDRLRARGFRVDADSSNEKLGYKIRHWKTQKVPYVLVVGKAEAAAWSPDGSDPSQWLVNVNERAVDEKRTETVDAFADELARRVAARR